MFQFEGDDAALLDDVAERLEPRLRAMPGVLGIREGEAPAPSEMALVIDRDRATLSGVSPEVIAGLVGYALRGTALPKFNYEGREIPVRIRFQERDRQSFTTLAGFQVPTAEGEAIPLSALTEQRPLKTPKGIFRSNKRITRNVTVELKPDEAKETRPRLQALQRQVDLPEGVTFGTAQVQTVNEELANMAYAAAISVVFIYLLMGFLFESFVLPLSIILTIPLAGIGVTWIHWVTGKDIDYLGAVGGVLLIGVVVNNGIVLVDYVSRLRAEGLSRREALLRAADRRFRPIAMTSLTTIIGMLPLTVQPASDIGPQLQKLWVDADWRHEHRNAPHPAGGARLLHVLRRRPAGPCPRDAGGSAAPPPAAPVTLPNPCWRCRCLTVAGWDEMAWSLRGGVSEARRFTLRLLVWQNPSYFDRCYSAMCSRGPVACLKVPPRGRTGGWVRPRLRSIPTWSR
ncbi:MAG: efflux RND transporter permease subunit [Verrucomicrobia bacterium]|nr:efflux RND transporter permease subunit [Verrucomicrobiota bacterium]